jgi:hypothetical protein
LPDFSVSFSNMLYLNVFHVSTNVQMVVLTKRTRPLPKSVSRVNQQSDSGFDLKNETFT